MKIVARTILAVALGLLASGPLAPYGEARAGTLGVPAPFATIQSAIDAASAGDVVLVQPGTYVESIDFLGKAITVRAAGDFNDTILDANRADRVVTFANGEGRSSVLEGFQVSRGRTTDAIGGGGILIDGASPVIRDCWIRDNRTRLVGGGIVVRGGGSPLLEGNDISENEVTSLLTDTMGSGLASIDSSPPFIA